MRHKYSMLLLLTSFISISSTYTAEAGGTYMELVGKGFAPPAAKSFCSYSKTLCSTSAGSSIVRLTSSKKMQLQAINVAVNSKIQKRSDLDTVGSDDRWSIPLRYGDCEDFAILKKQELIKRGWPAAALLLTVARLKFSGEGHVVLTVRTSEGDLILDSRTNAVKDWSKTSYQYYARQTQKGAGWQRIGAAIPLKATTKQ